MINRTRNKRALFGLRFFGISGTGFFICLTLLLGPGIAAGQTAQPTALDPSEPLERYDNPPAYIYRLETGPRMISQFGPFVSFQVNVDSNGNNILGDAANESSIAVDPTNGSKMTIGWRQFDSVLSNFRQGGWGYTTDGGTNWTFPGVLENNVFRSDPVLHSDETGRFFYLSLLELFCDDIWRSTNGGQTWTRLPPEGGGGGGDKEWFTIDKTNGMGHGFQYQVWSTAAPCSFGQFSRSTDGGLTWQSPLSLPNSPVWGTLDVDTNGNLFIGGASSFSSPFWCLRSSNAQNPNVTPTFDQITQVNLGGSLVFGGAINPGGLAGQLFLAVDRSGGLTNNNIYMLASVQTTGNGTDVMFARSTNGGVNFSAPHRINDDPVNSNKWHWFGTLSVAPNGRIDAVWFDTRNAANNTDSQLFYSYSTDGGVTWAANVAVSNPFNPFEGYPNQNKIGDYITIVSDNTGGNVAYAATFNLNPNRGQHEEDIYYVRVFPTGAPIPTPTPPPTATPTPAATPLSQLGNTSTRAFVQTGDDAMIGGFIVRGSQSKRVIIRAIGPELTRYGVPNPLFNPTLELHNGTGALIASNDNWHETIIGGIITADQFPSIVNSRHAPRDGRESAIIADLPPGKYTAIVRGVDNMTGVALLEVYDLSGDASSILANISTRSSVQTGNDVMIGGFIVRGSRQKRVIIRAIGPELGAPPFNIPNALFNPTLELHNGTGALIASNDNWVTTIIGGINTSNQVAEIRSSGHAPRDGRESAIIADLPPGNYTAIVRGVNNTTGVALVEVYDLDR